MERGGKKRNSHFCKFVNVNETWRDRIDGVIERGREMESVKRGREGWEWVVEYTREDEVGE